MVVASRQWAPHMPRGRSCSTRGQEQYACLYGSRSKQRACDPRRFQMLKEPPRAIPSRVKWFIKSDPWM